MIDIQDWLDGEEFDSAMYSYRTAPSTDPEWVMRAFEAVKTLFRHRCRLIEPFPRQEPIA